MVKKKKVTGTTGHSHAKKKKGKKKEKKLDANFKNSIPVMDHRP